MALTDQELADLLHANPPKVKISDFLSFVTPHAPTISEPLAMEGIRAALHKFCVKTMCWRASSIIDTIGGAQRYDLALVGTDPNTENYLPRRAYRVLTVTFKGEWLEPILFEKIMREEENFRNDTGKPRRWFVEIPGTITIWPHPAVPDSPTPPETPQGKLAVNYQCIPTQDAEFVPGFIYDLYGQTIANGALQYLFAMPGKEWTQPDLAVFYGNMFEEGVALHSQAATIDSGRAAVRVTAVK